MTEIQLFTVLGAVLIVFLGMFALQWRGQVSQDKAQDNISRITQILAQTLAGSQLALSKPQLPILDLKPVPASPPVPAIAVAPALPVVQHGPAPAPAGPPPWFAWASHEIGFHESGSNQGIGKYIQLAHCGAEGDPWCAIFANAALEAVSLPGTRSPSSQSFRTDPHFVALAAPALGAIAVYWRIAKNSGQGHVGFYAGEDATRVWTLGGNENDAVLCEALPKDSATFGLIGYWWPKSVALPTTGPVMMPAGTPAQISPGPKPLTPPVAAPAYQTGIIATVFGGQQSAYGGAIDDAAPGVALPCRFEGARPQVVVSNAATGKSVTCDIVDVGPWNTNDPYWQTGTRPQAESGTDMTGRHTNGAGIDLTLAAASAIGIDGKGKVNWDFVTQTTPMS